MNEYDPNYIHQNVFAIVGQKAIVLNDQGQILLLQRSEKAGGGGMGSFPGGALENMEDPYEGMQREIVEEAQLEVSELTPFYVRSYPDKENNFCVILAYKCVSKNQDVKLNWEHDDYKWLSREEVLSMNLTKDARFIAEHI